MVRCMKCFRLRRRRDTRFLLLCLCVCCFAFLLLMNHIMQQQRLINRYCKKTTLPTFTQNSITNQTDVSFILANHLFLKTSPNTNIVFCPLSIQVVLGVMAAGSSGRILNELLVFLKTNNAYDLSTLSWHLISSIMVDGSICGGPSLCFANGVWVDQTLSFKPSFKHVLDTVYRTTSKQVDFKHKADEVVKDVNLWAEKQTNGLIKEVVSGGAFDSSTMLIFANTLYFKGVWIERFDMSKTKNFDFHLGNDNIVTVPFMTSTEDQLVSVYHDFRVLGLPYVHGEDKRSFKMYIFLPNEKNGLRTLLKKMGSQSDFLECHIPSKKVKIGRFFIPKFKFSLGFEVTTTLKDLGLVLPFEGGNGLTEMVETLIGVSSFYQKSFVEVNKEGTEAAAVTLGSFTFVSIDDDEVDFVADHPFVFMIRDDISRVVLFMGQLIDPR